MTRRHGQAICHSSSPAPRSISRLASVPWLALLLCAAACSRAAPPPGASMVLVPHICTAVRHAATGQASIVAVGKRAPGEPFGDIATITWRTPGLNTSVVRVSEDSGPAKRFTGAGRGGVAHINWILPGHTFVFGLYPTASSRAVLASVAVRQC
jgi:hypothetical protein